MFFHEAKRCDWLLGFAPCGHDMVKAPNMASVGHTVARVCLLRRSHQSLVLLAALGAFVATTPTSYGKPALPYGTHGTVVLDDIQVKGVEGALAEIAKAAVEVPFGIQIQREHLDEAIEAAMVRLRAIGYFKRIGFELLRGSRRGHFILEMTLVPHRQEYLGLTMTRYQPRRRAPISPKATWLNAYVGTRDFFGSGLSLELEQGYLELDFVDGSDFRFDLNQSTLRVFDRSIVGSSLFFGIGASSNAGSYRGGGDFRGKAHSEEIFAATGNRFGLLLAALGMARSRNYYYAKSQISFAEGPDFEIEEQVVENSGRYFNTTATLQLKYSQKSFQAEVEPGPVLGVKYQFTPAEESDSGELVLNGEWTWIFAGSHAFTPSLLQHMSWFGTGSSRELYRELDLALKYQYVLSIHDVVLTFEGGEGRTIDPGEYEQDFARRPFWQAGISRNTAGFNLALFFVYGNQGIRGFFSPYGSKSDPTQFSK